MEASWADGWLRAAVREAASKPLPHTREELEDFRTLGRAHLLRSLGLEDLPHNHRPPPPAHPSGSASYSGFRLERWVLETRPGVKATVLLYRPEGRGPFPVILNPHGHWPLKKAEPVVQARAIEQARSGFLAVVVDSPGHSWEGDRPVERKALGTHWDFVPTCAGITATGVYVWDLVRTLDFVQTLPFADADRVGITGESGGGTATVYTFAVDRRIRCAVPVVYACSLEDQPDNGCPCNHLPDILSLGDRAHALAIRAPSPVLLLGATDDEEFPPDAMRKTAAKLSEMGRKLGFDDFAGVEIFEGPHTYSEPMRQVALRFFDTHLRPDRPASVRGGFGELPIEPPGSPRLLCDPEPQRGTATFRSLAIERLQSPASFPTDATRHLGALGRSGFDRLADAAPPEASGETLVLCDQQRMDLPREWTPMRAPGLWGEPGPSARYCTILCIPTALIAAASLTTATRRRTPEAVVAIGPMACIATLLAACLGANIRAAVLGGLPSDHLALLQELPPQYEPAALPILPLAHHRGDFQSLAAMAKIRSVAFLPQDASLADLEDALAHATGRRRKG